MNSVELFGLCFVVTAISGFGDTQNFTENEIRPYEFTFNIADFQHRFEKKDDDGLITGEYGFITADGIYHETAYATDITGDFIITKMKHRKITSLKDVEEIFKDKPEQAKMLEEALVKSCTGCGITELERQESSSFVKAETTTTSTVVSKKMEARLNKKLDLAMKEMMKVLNEKSSGLELENADDKFSRKEKKLPRVPIENRTGKELNPPIDDTTNEIIRDMVNAAKKVIQNDDPENEREELTSLEVLDKMASDLFYRFNYTITSHGHWEDGFRDGRKDGEYNAKFIDGIDAHVKYTSNEFGHQPNITLVPRLEPPSLTNNNDNDQDSTNEQRSSNNFTEELKLPYKGHYFNWFKK